MQNNDISPALAGVICAINDMANKNPREIESMERGRILDRAKKIINGERQTMYGSPENSFPKIAEFWTTYLTAQGVIPEGKKISAKQSSDMMALYKMAREACGAGKDDNLVDACAYIALSADLAGYCVGE